jgi:hypothetical protein
MSLDGQMDKLSAVYAEKSDGELLGLFEQRDGLTEMAQQALAGVMRERGLGARGAAPVETEDVESDGNRAESVAESEGLVYLFHDAFEAREAIRHMREAGVAHRMLDWHAVEPEMEKSYTGVDLGLVVERVDAKRAVQVLKEAMGLFPGPEDVAGDDGGDEGGLVVLSMFDREEALAAAHALGEVGITFLWRDGRDETAGLPDEETIAIEVRAEDMDRAAGLVEKALAAR